MAAIHQGIGRQGGEFAQAGEHVRRIAFEQPAAAQAEQCVAAQQRGTVRIIEGDMPDRMAGRVDDLAHGVADRHRVALLHGPVEFWQPMGIRRRAHDRAAKARPNFVGAAHMIGVVMRQQDQVQPPTGGHDGGLDGAGIGRVHHGRGAGGAVAQQPGVVVLEQRNGGDAEGHDRAPVI